MLKHCSQMSWQGIISTVALGQMISLCAHVSVALNYQHKEEGREDESTPDCSPKWLWVGRFIGVNFIWCFSFPSNCIEVENKKKERRTWRTEITEEKWKQENQISGLTLLESLDPHFLPLIMKRSTSNISLTKMKPPAYFLSCLANKLLMKFFH